MIHYAELSKVFSMKNTESSKGETRMIEKINMMNVASYDNEGIGINLEKVNYIYGSNGSGKTTISEFLRTNDDMKFSSCNIEWEKNNAAVDMFVYNRQFVRENFNIRNEIKGIFTLGKESTEILSSIEEKIKLEKKHEEKVGNLIANKGEKEKQLKDLVNDFTSKCWDLKLKYDEQFKEAFTGVRNNKEKFMLRCLEEAKGSNSSSNLHTYEELQKRFKYVFQISQNRFSPIKKVEYDITLEKSPIFDTKIIGKKDIDIASLISKLNISDWVQQGHEHLEKSNGICPFCQQELQSDFKSKLDEYFDETYNEQIQLLFSSIVEYEKGTLSIMNDHDYLKDENNPYVNTENIENIFKVINSTYEKNKQMLENKKREPSRTINLSSIKSYIDQINEEIEKANKQISEHNRVVDNIKEERKQLTNDIWRFIVEENKYYYQSYQDQYEKINKSIEGMDKGLETRNKFLQELRQEVINLQNQLTSVLPSINEINNLLKNFGFTNFELAESEEEGNYKIIRENGDDANETLSEGEKTFITFLYFYQLINGSNEQNKVNTERIIVVDDPISSLDSNILFIVSNLINRLKQKVRSNDSMFKQLLIFTHNVYFHKEISFNKGKGNKKLNDETFWILRKIDDITRIKEYKENPIKNSYELLWKELKENQNSITTPNIMRRILENYFKFFGNIDINEIIEEFPDKDKVVCDSLLSWVNDGSHHINDDLYVDINPELNEKYFDVFKRIFVISNHESHFNMMMGEIEYENEVQQALKEAAASQE